MQSYELLESEVHQQFVARGLTDSVIGQFRALVYSVPYREFPWRNTSDLYSILVSELMLQQTQASRVVPKYLEFLERFPTASDLAKAETAELLTYWQGLGYNRRALFLRKAAQYLVEHGEPEKLTDLPGVGPYTAAALTAFSHNKPIVCIETNIRRVYLYLFFRDQEGVGDTELLPIIEETMDTENPRSWYYALMDYGAELVKRVPNPNRRSKHHVVQSKFLGSVRQVRGEIVRRVTAKGVLIAADLEDLDERREKALEGLEKDGFITIEGGIVTLKK